jgi:hypothetical protein
MNCSGAEHATGSEWIAASIWARVFPERATALQLRNWRLRELDRRNECPWCDSRVHWSGSVEGCPSRSSSIVVAVINTLIEPGETWQAYAMRLRKLLTDEVERVA